MVPIILDFGADWRPTSDDLGSSCHDVLIRNLDDSVYIGDFTNLLTVGSVDLALIQAYSKILRLLHHVAALSSIRNTFAFVSHLPAEVLLRIFHFCVPQPSEEQRHRFAFSQVCASWRYLALADPSLWTQIDLRKPALAKVMVERSQPLPVSIYTSSPGDLLLSSNFLPDRARLRSLVLSHCPLPPLCDTAGLAHPNSEYLSGRFPLLQTLSLVNERTVYSLDNVEDLNAPQLRALSLHNVFLLHWAAPAMKKITSLALTHAPAGSSRVGRNAYKFTLTSLFGVLKETPQLISLKLEGLVDVIRAPLDADHLIAAGVSLSRLRQLHLCEAVSTIEIVLCKLHMPIVNDIVIIPKRGAVCISKLSDIVSDYLRSANWPPLHHARLEVGRLHDFRIVAEENGSQSTPWTHRLEITTLYHFSGSDMTAFFTLAVSSILLRRLVKLHVKMLDVPTGQPDLPAALPHLWMLLSTLPTLENLELGSAASLVGLMCSLDPGLAFGSFVNELTRPSDPFPALREITLQGAEKKSCKLHNDQSGLGNLVTFLNHRRQQGKPVNTALGGCQLSV